MRTWQELIDVLYHDLQTVRDQANRGEYRSAAAGCFEIADEAKELSGLLQIEQRRKGE